MANTTFALHDLGWHAFQQLCHTVLREVLGQTVTSYLDTNDGGRDGGFGGTWRPADGSSLAGEFVVQCKHTAVAQYRLKLSDMEDELAKASRLVDGNRCDVYVLMTNAGVSGKAEERISDALRATGVKHVLVLGATWLNQTISENPRLRRLVPRLYGLGDLTEILDERAYSQARAVLDAMRTDLSKLVLTGTYHRAASALSTHAFVLLLGAPATGKTTIAAQLALGAADEFGTAVVKLDRISELRDRWNPDDRQLFWLDDAFGATQFDRPLARDWVLALPRVRGAVDAGCLFVLTSRTYVFNAARSYLKPGSFPLLDESQVVVNVSDLTSDERRQILYNHLRHGRQPNSFIAALQPHLDEAADHAEFTPELARRLSDPMFTTHVEPESAGSVRDFFSRPMSFLRDVMAGLDGHARAALGLVFINGNFLRSPLQPNERDDDLLARMASDLGGVTDALGSMSGSLVQHIVHDGHPGWVFSHPTMIDAYADLLRTPEFLHHFVAGFPLDILLAQVTCGDVGVRGAVIVPPTAYEIVLDRLDEPPAGDRTEQWWARGRRSTFLATRCDRRFLEMWVDRHPDAIDGLATPGLMLEADADNELTARLVEYGLFPEEFRKQFGEDLIEYCVAGIDPAVVWNDRLRAVLTPDEQGFLFEKIRTELLTHPMEAISNCTEGWSSDGNYGAAKAAVDPLRSLVRHLPKMLPGPDVAQALRRLDQMIDSWVASQDEPERQGRDATPGPSSPAATRSASEGRERSIFDDLLYGRTSPSPRDD